MLAVGVPRRAGCSRSWDRRVCYRVRDGGLRVDEPRAVLVRAGVGPAVLHIVGDGVAQVLQVHADLVRAPRARPAPPCARE